MALISSTEKIRRVEPSALTVVHYPDPRLAEMSTPVEVFDDHLRRLSERMFELMVEHRGVGLAAPQVGVTVRLFVASPGFEEGDRRVYVNPKIMLAEGSQDDEEGCLSVPGVNCKIKRANRVTVRASDLEGKVFEETGEGFIARIYQHEIDHLDGKLLIDRMGTVARLANRKLLKELQDEYADGKG